jgi:hypothetical protein
MSALEEHDAIQVILSRNLNKYLNGCGHTPDGKVYLEFPVPGKNEPVGYLDLLVETQGRGIAIIDSIGETLRQISKYRAAAPWCDCPYQYGRKVHLNSARHYKPEFWIASPDYRFIDVIEGQGIGFLKVGEAARKRSREIRERVAEIQGQEFVGIQDGEELEELRSEYARHYGVAALKI